jgi:hypothetical protein
MEKKRKETKEKRFEKVENTQTMVEHKIQRNLER